MPPGWRIEIRGRARAFISPDGMTEFSTLAKALRYHKQQEALAARFQQQFEQQRQREDTKRRRNHAFDGEQPTASEAVAAAAPASTDASADEVRSSKSRSPTTPHRSSPRGKPSSAGAEQAFLVDAVEEGKELQNLALPNRERTLPPGLDKVPSVAKRQEPTAGDFGGGDDDGGGVAEPAASSPQAQASAEGAPMASETSDVESSTD